MCHNDADRPPAPPVVGKVASTAQLELVSQEGHSFAAYEALPETNAADVGVVILPDVRGLHPYYVALAERFAEAGVAAIAIDYFGRTDGVAMRDDDFDWKSKVFELTPSNVEADAAAAVARLRVEHGIERVYSLGFCFGGGQSWRLAATSLGLSGAVGFYGRPAYVGDAVDQIGAPLLMLAAGADQGIPVAEVEELAQRLQQAGKTAELHVYDGAPHSFFDRTYAEWQEACADAWRRILSFMQVPVAA
ncbi:MAG: dienelactone hydrolase family protein [Actinomycetales bacterium]